MALANVVNNQMLDDALLWLLTFYDHSNTLVLRAVNNLEDVVSRGDTFTAFPFELKLPPEDGQKPQSVSLSFVNVGRELMGLVREYGVDLAPKVKLELVLSSDPDKVEKSIDFMSVANVQYDALGITFELSSSSVFARKTCTGTYNQVEFPGLFFALGAGGGLGHIPPQPEYPVDPEYPDKPPTTPPPTTPPAELPPEMDFENLFPDHPLLPDGRAHYDTEMLIGSREFALKIEIPTLSTPALLLIEERSTGDGAKDGNLSTTKGFGLPVLDERIGVGTGVIGSYVFPAGAARTVWFNMRQQDLNVSRMSASLIIILRRRG